MSQTVQILLPPMPECWQTCGACGDGELLVSDIPLAVGDRVWRDEPMLSLETDKTTLDIPAPRSGRVSALHVEIGDPVQVGSLLMTLQPE